MSNTRTTPRAAVMSDSRRPGRTPDQPNPDRSNNAWIGDLTWIESESGFPAGSLGADPTLRPDPEDIVTSTDGHNLTGEHIADLIAFTEFLAGTAFDQGERDWLTDAMGRDFLTDPVDALQQMVPVKHAVDSIPTLEPFERANNRFKALTKLYRTEPIREQAKLPETPIMTMIKAHNPALLSEKTGIVVVADALTARQRINELILDLAGFNLDDLPHLRNQLTQNYHDAPLAMKAELAGSQIRLVVLRSWLADLPQADMDQLRSRLTEVIDTSTDLDLVTLQLSFRSMIEAIGGEDDD